MLRVLGYYFVVLVAFMLSSVCIVSLSLARAQSRDEELVGVQAEQAGKLRDALTHYVAAVQNASDGSDADQRLREKIIALVQKLKPPPTVPTDARTHLGRGQAAVEIAKDSDDFLRAADEFRQVSRIAPWLASAYFNLGVVQDKAGQYADAIRNLKLYLLAAPSASDADDVRAKIAGLEYKLERQREDERAVQEKGRAEQAARDEELRAEKERRDALAWLVDSPWKYKMDFPSPGLGNQTFWGTFSFKVIGDRIEGYAYWERSYTPGSGVERASNPRPILQLRGDFQRGDASSIRWKVIHRDCDDPSNESLQTWVDVPLDVSYDKRTINFWVLNAPCEDVKSPVTLSR